MLQLDVDDYGVDGVASTDICQAPGRRAGAVAIGARSASRNSTQNFEPRCGPATSRRRRQLPAIAGERDYWGDVRRGRTSRSLEDPRGATSRSATTDYSDFGGTTNPKFSAALAADQGSAGARLVGHGVRGAVADAGLRRADLGSVDGRPRGSAALPDDAGHQRLPDAVHAGVRRQPGPQAARRPRSGRSASCSSRRPGVSTSVD